MRHSRSRLVGAHRAIRKGLRHPNRLIGGATWLILLIMLAVLVRLVIVLIDGFWLFFIALMQP